MSRMYTYKVSVFTGKQWYAGTMNYVYLTMAGKDSFSDRTLLNKSLFEQFPRGKEMHFEISVDETLGDDLLVTLEKERFLFEDDWYCSYVCVTPPSGEDIYFPCYRWITNEKKVVLRDGKGRLPQDDEKKELRQKELLETRSSFRWMEWNPAFPMSIAANSSTELPLDIQFDTEKNKDFKSNIKRGIKNLGLSELESLFQSSWKSIEDFQEIFVLIKDKGLAERVMHEWQEDSLFGYQFLNGCNPVVIKKCDELPRAFDVTEEMVKNSLERGETLEKEIQDGNIYIADYELLDGVEANATDPNTQQYLTAPFCLLYKNKDDYILPIAIQLTRFPDKTNTVFLPEDNHNDWTLAKMWVKSCDFNLHQLDTHLLRTHLTSEVFAMAMFRQLAVVHPVYKLLIPHVRFTIAINTAARETLINKTGLFDKIMSTGGDAIGEVIQKAMETLTFRSLHICEATHDRGVDKDLPNYHYRDDGYMVWDAIRSFVNEVVSIYYRCDEDVIQDEEIQAFVQDVCFAMKKYHKTDDFPVSLKTREKLVEYLTVVIFTASAQHAAVNFGQFDWNAWIPNSPCTMRKPPPTHKGQVDMKYIMESLPDSGRSCWQLATVWALSQFEKDEIFLQSKYQDHYFTEKGVLDAIETFRKELYKVSNKIKIRNEKQIPELRYKYLSPDRIPNSVAV